MIFRDFKRTEDNRNNTPPMVSPVIE